MAVDPTVVVTPVLSFIAGGIGSYIVFRLQIERFMGKDEQREKHHNERHEQVMHRLDRIEQVLQSRRQDDPQQHRWDRHHRD